MHCFRLIGSQPWYFPRNCIFPLFFPFFLFSGCHKGSCFGRAASTTLLDLRIRMASASELCVTAGSNTWLPHVPRQGTLTSAFQGRMLTRLWKSNTARSAPTAYFGALRVFGLGLGKLIIVLMLRRIYIPLFGYQCHVKDVF